MKIVSELNVKDYFWNSIKNITNTFSNLRVNSLGNGYIQCLWEIGTVDNLRIEFSKSCFYAIRLFDITNNRNKTNSTCIMKEIQVNKFQSSISFPIPLNKGVYYFEFGYRKRNGQWRKLASQEINLGYRIKKIIQNIDSDNWFKSKQKRVNTFVGMHENAYQLSLNSYIGGSEKTSFDEYNE